MTNRELEALVARLPQHRGEICSYIEKAKKLKRDCGCSMGALFLVGSTFIVAVLPLVVSAVRERGSVAKYARLYSAIAVLILTVIGKLTGLAIARIRLALVCKLLVKKYCSLEQEHVGLH